MAEDTYELRLEQEGFHIIPVQGGEVDLQGGVGGQIAVQLLPQGASSKGLGLKELPSNLFLSGAGAVEEGEKVEGQLVIQYGDSWFHDLLTDLGSLGGSALDYPVFCADGIAWSNRLLLASVSPILTSNLESEDSCLILPDCLVSHFTQFQQHLFSKALPLTSVAAVSKVASLLGVPSHLLPRTPSSTFNTPSLDYQAIFSRQQREYLDKCCGNRWVANQVLKVADRPARRRQPLDFLASVMRPTSPLGDEQENVWCDQCSISFSNSALLDQHIEILHKALAKPRERNFPCNFCDKRFHFQENVQKHIILVHPGRKEGPDGKENVEGASEVNQSDRNISPTKDSPNKITNQNQASDISGQFKCNICGDHLRSKRALLAHMQAHYGGGYKCDFPGCESVFKENAKLTRHKLVHTGVKAWKCSYCHLAFSLKHNLKMHEKTHTRTDMLKCRICNYQTIQKSNLRLHEATHGEAGIKVKREARDSSPTSSPLKGTEGAGRPVEEQAQEEGGAHETHDEIEKFIAEMEKDQDL